LKTLVVDSLDGLFAFLKDNNSVVSSVSARTLCKISNKYPEFFLAHQNFSN
jgi:hypothetical protein